MLLSVSVSSLCLGWVYQHLKSGLFLPLSFSEQVHLPQVGIGFSGPLKSTYNNSKRLYLSFPDLVCEYSHILRLYGDRRASLLER